MINRFNYQRFILSCAPLVLLPFILGARSCENDINLGVDHGTAGSSGAGIGAKGGSGAGGRSSKGTGSSRAGAGGTDRSDGTTLTLCDISKCGSTRGMPDLRCRDGNRVSVCAPISSGRCDWIMVGCPTPPEDPCHGCDRNEYCQVPACGRNDAEGKCVAIPSYCQIPSPGLAFDPYCGCDGWTYETDCRALLQGVLIDHKGECTYP